MFHCPVGAITFRLLRQRLMLTFNFKLEDVSLTAPLVPDSKRPLLHECEKLHACYFHVKLLFLIFGSVISRSNFYLLGDWSLLSTWC